MEKTGYPYEIGLSYKKRNWNYKSANSIKQGSKLIVGV